MAKTNFNELIQSKTPLLIDFYADWCGPCKAMSPILKELAGKVGGTARIIKINVDKNQALAQRFEVRGIPTFMLFKAGEIKWRKSGMASMVELQKVIREHQ